MTNPFRKRKYTTLGTGLVLGGVAAGLAAYLFYSKKGSGMRDMLAGKIDQLRMKLFDKKDAAEGDSQPADYLAHPTKTPKTDRDKLLKGEILAS